MEEHILSTCLNGVHFGRLESPPLQLFELFTKDEDKMSSQLIMPAIVSFKVSIPGFPVITNLDKYIVHHNADSQFQWDSAYHAK